MCVLPLTYFRRSIHTAQKKKIPQFSHTPLSFSRFIPHSAILCSPSLPFSPPHCCFPPSATSSFPLLSLLFLTTRSFQSCLCPQDSFFLSLISLFPTLLSLSFSPPYISLLSNLFFYSSPLSFSLALSHSVSCCLCPHADAASHPILNGDGMIEIGMIDGQ